MNFTVVGLSLVTLAGLFFLLQTYAAVLVARYVPQPKKRPDLLQTFLPTLPLIIGLWLLHRARPDWPQTNLGVVWLAALGVGFLLHFAIAKLVPRRPDQ